MEMLAVLQVLLYQPPLKVTSLPSLEPIGIHTSVTICYPWEEGMRPTQAMEADVHRESHSPGYPGHDADPISASR